MSDEHLPDVPLHLLQMERYLWTILSMDMTAVIDLEGAFLDANPGWLKGMGFTPDQLIGSYLLDYLHVEERERVLSQMQRLVTAEFETTTLDFRFRGNDGEFRHLLVNVAYTPEHECYYLLARSLSGCGRDSMVSAYHDVLTGLPNRYFLHRRLKDALEKLEESRHSLAVMFVDLDHFKPINDTFGHKAGDQVLRETARRLEDCVAPEGFAARLGGDEFVVVLQGENLGMKIGTVASRILEQVGEPFVIQGESVSIGASIGISLHPQGGRSPDELLQTADKAMYDVKRSGRGGFRIEELEK